NAGVLPEVMDALSNANNGHTRGYGDDIYTDAAVTSFKKEFGDATEVYFVFNGTGANVVGLQAMVRPYEAVICAQTAHINVDECAAPEKFLGGKLIDLPTPGGKLTPELILPVLHGFGDQHHVQPKVVSITQSTEMGTIYSLEEIKTLCDFAHAHGLLVHMDGARISNAAAALDASLADVTVLAGVDLLSFGGTKNGLMFGEAILVFNPVLNEGLKFIRKQSAQLPSKMRFIAVQFQTLLNNEVWRKYALHANQMARLLASEAEKVPEVRITQKVDSNGVFAIIPKEWIAPLQKQSFFYVWDEAASEVRWMTSFDTSKEDVMSFVALLHKMSKENSSSFTS
ncbi:MAG TPA: beta-eliminating lyase-related protein, partial [Marinilabiliaceae bacterium]|nr:beta-eliminating lyase-related protein [Marinilabiliaceae bacterium]